MNKVIAYHSDCGLYSTEPGKVCGLIKTLSPDTIVESCSVGFEKDNIMQLSAYLFTTLPYWPDNSLFLSLMGKGRPVAVKTDNGSIIVSYDNGTATMCVKHFGFKGAVLIDEDKYGNDGYVLVRAVADLSNGKAMEDLGTPLTKEDIFFFKMPEAKISDGRAEGEVSMLLKGFGNITFSIGTDEFEGTNIHHGDKVRVTFTKDNNIEYQEEMTYQPSFGYVGIGEPVIFNGSSGYMDIGLNLKSFINTCIPQILEVENPGDYKVVIERI
ncbi:MAG: SAM-dependent chlorinase/fluorinase [Erysipelotrichaceae bacterium]|nr:SAM-dependent chlorinase/fluorinase [Erysipelotrichaceae bacterium]